ncbi:MAG TPA: glycosyltransferase family 39 protein [Bacteroidota bacterium]|nr:glycosyltransferase family 39 protein [Bacteroidota bacterium]
MKSADTWRIFSDDATAAVRRNLLVYIFIPLISFALHVHIFPRDLVGFHVWRQTHTQINIDNFYSEDLNILHPRINERGDGDGIHRMEFPVMQWLFALVYRLLGHDVALSRLLSFIIGVLSLYGIYHLIRNVFRDNRHAALGVWAFCFSPVFYYYTVNPMPDNFALCCSLWGMALFFKYIRTKSFVDASFSAACLGAATLAKLPYVLCLAGVGAYIVSGIPRLGSEERKEYFRLAALYIAMLIPAVIWYAAVIPQWSGNGIVLGMLDSRLPPGEILKIMRFHLMSSLPELLVNYGSVIFFLAGIVSVFRRKTFARSGFLILGCWGIGLLLYFLFEMNMIGYVHDYYLLPFLPPVFLIVFEGIRYLMSSNRRYLRVAATVCLLVLPLAAFLRINHRWDLESPGLNRDLLVYKADLQNAVPNDALCVVGNDESHHIFFYYINKKGWGFHNNGLDHGRLKGMIIRGARYLYSDSRGIDENETIQPLIGDLVLERGSIRVYRLRLPPDQI